jgi:hypothetical protein
VRNLAGASILAVVLVAGAACGSSGPDPAARAASRQAVERLRAYGLPAAEARCIVERVGAQVVNETAQLEAFVDSEQYQDAAEACRAGG